VDESYRVEDPSRIPTPALLVYPEKARANIARAVAVAGGPERLRPHVKTHKCPEIVALLRAAGIGRFKCATLTEAEMTARAGARDVMIAYQMVGANIERFVRLLRAFPDVSFKPIVDHPAPLATLGAALAAARLEVEVLLDLDSGMHRTGVAIGPDAAALYRKIARTDGVRPGGLHCYDGHIHDGDLEARRRAAAEGRDAVLALRDSLARESLPVPRIVMGGTPTFPCHALHPEVELSPGTFVLHDGNYLTDFPDLGFQPAALLLARVVSLPAPDRITIDLGHKAVAADPAGQRGFLVSVAGAEPQAQSEEHWVWSVNPRHALAPGDPVYVLPAHICPTVALHERLIVIESGRWTGNWRVAARTRQLSA
jgi:D-threonine aldolase